MIKGVDSNKNLTINMADIFEKRDHDCFKRIVVPGDVAERLVVPGHGVDSDKKSAEDHDGD